MELTIKPYHSNQYPLGAVLIKHASAKVWLLEIQQMGLALAAVDVFAIAGTTANSIWGCMVVFNGAEKPLSVGKNYYCQQIQNKLFIPENAVLYPQLSVAEMERLFSANAYLLHPEVGLVELSEPVNWSLLLASPQASSHHVKQPNKGVHIPSTINSFQIREIAVDDMLANMDEQSFPKKESFDNRPLSTFEKIKMGLLQKLFGSGKDSESQAGSGVGGKDDMAGAQSTGTNQQSESWLQKIGNWLSPKAGGIFDKWKTDLEALEKRNQDELNKLLEMFRKNPEDALKYAIPLNEDGTTRGGNEGAFNMSKRWFDLSIFGNHQSYSGSGNTIMPGDSFATLQKQYNQTAEAFIQNKEYQKAAFVYLKLLKNGTKAAQTLEKGEMYGEAASVYLKYGDNKQKAAECYEKGSMTIQAIDLYKELNDHEKVGDLYLTTNRKKEAHQFFEQVVEKYKTNSQYIKASLVYRHKIEDTTRAQDLLMQGWRDNKDAFNCLNNYFANIADTKQLQQEIESVYGLETNNANLETFLHAIRHEFLNHPEVAGRTKEIAYEIVAKKLATNPDILSELNLFNPQDSHLKKDILKFKQR